MKNDTATRRHGDTGKRLTLRVAASPCLRVFFCLFASASWAIDTADSQARFGEVTGTVEILSQGAAQWVDAHIDLPLEIGDQIRLGDDGAAELSLAQNVLVALGHDTAVVVGRITAREGALSIRQGSVSGKIESTDGITGPWRFETPVGVCAVRGTEFTLTHSEEGGTHLGVMEGAVEMTPAETATESFAPVMINAREEGVLQKRKPLKKMNGFSPAIQAHTGQMTRVRKRYSQVSGVWVPLTVEYRKMLRQKYIAPVPKRKAAPAKPRAPRRTKGSTL